MPPYMYTEPPPADVEHDDKRRDSSFRDYWKSFTNWITRFAQGINNETIEHPYYIAFAFVVIWAWPHLLCLPVWFTKDAARRMEDHARTATSRITAPTRRRKRDFFITRYRSIVSAGYEPTSRPPLFGGTPLTDGNFSVEEERSLPVVLRIIRWSALVWAAFILGRELYHLMFN